MKKALENKIKHYKLNKIRIKCFSIDDFPIMSTISSIYYYGNINRQ